MKASDSNALRRLFGGGSEGDGLSELQELLLQIVLAIMMIFIIAFFIFRDQAERQREEQLMELVRQKLVMSSDTVEKAFRTRYGLDVLMTRDAKGVAVCDASSLVKSGGLVDVPSVRNAFTAGAAAAYGDYAAPAQLSASWKAQILAAAGLSDADLSEDDRAWLSERLEKGISGVRKEVVSLQRSCAARLQLDWLEGRTASPDAELTTLVSRLKGVDPVTRLSLAREISATLKTRSLERLSELAHAPLLQ